MSTSNTAASAASPATQPQLSGGLYLKGTVIAVRTEEKEWEKEKYTQTTVEVSDGQQVYSMRHRHDASPYQPPKLFSEIKVRVTYATTEKGKISVKGLLV
ncbi:MAG: hypothetical protein QG602_2409 [Verrucomicrobiota bacterium]|nr:hypothetical protein [Verrucomicrobiota bacterium]